MLAKLLIPASGIAAGLISSVDFSGTIGLGSILVGLLVTILAGSVNLRSGLLKQQIIGWKGNFEQEKIRADQLDKRLQDALKLIEQQRAEIAELHAELAEERLVRQRLEQLPNLERVIQLISDMQERAEKRSVDRHRELMAAVTPA